MWILYSTLKGSDERQETARHNILGGENKHFDALNMNKKVILPLISADTAKPLQYEVPVGRRDALMNAITAH